MNGISSSGSSSERWRTIRNFAGGGAHDSMSVKNNNTILRFRPIAPKPATCPSGSSNRNSNNNSEILVFTCGERRKRKYVRVRRNSGYTRKKKPNDSVLCEVEEQKCGTTILQLLPDRSADLNRPMKPDLAAESGYVVQAWVTIERVAATCTTVEKRDNRTVQVWVVSLESDACPGFVSDGLNCVTWMNGAFRKMVTTDENGEVVAMLVIKERFPSFYSSFTGHVKLQYYYHHASGSRDRKTHSRVVPCDLWRIDGGGFAWRLDVDSALTLGRT